MTAIASPCYYLKLCRVFVIIPGTSTMLLIHKLLPIFYWSSLVLDLIQNPLAGTGIFFPWVKWTVHHCIFSWVYQNCNITGGRTLVFNLFFFSAWRQQWSFEYSFGEFSVFLPEWEDHKVEYFATDAIKIMNSDKQIKLFSFSLG